MKLLLLLASKSIWNRRFTTILMMFSVALSVSLILGIERIRTGAKSSFQNTISGTDLILGARAGSIQLLLFSVFRIGNPTNNISWDSYQRFASHPDVLEAVPITLGDSHRGFSVIGTTSRYFSFYQYSGGRPLRFRAGQPFIEKHDAVISAEIADKFHYKLGQEIVLAHGTGQISLHEHENHPFVIAGILEPTGTPVDRAIYVPLEGIEAIHEDNHREPGPQQLEISAMFLRLKTKFGLLLLLREINEYDKEALTAILPGLTLLELWRMIGVVENALLTISFLAFIISLIGMVLVLLSGLNERRREMAILRSVGAGPSFIFSLLVSEALILAVLGSAFGYVLLNGFLFAVQPLAQNRFGIDFILFSPSLFELSFLTLIIFGALIASLVPAIRAYRTTLSDGLTIQT